MFGILVSVSTYYQFLLLTRSKRGQTGHDLSLSLSEAKHPEQLKQQHLRRRNNGNNHGNFERSNIWCDVLFLFCIGESMQRLVWK